jgi:hypothetical protein
MDSQECVKECIHSQWANARRNLWMDAWMDIIYMTLRLLTDYWLLRIKRNARWKFNGMSPHLILYRQYIPIPYCLITIWWSFKRQSKGTQRWDSNCASVQKMAVISTACWGQSLMTFLYTWTSTPIREPARFKIRSLSCFYNQIYIQVPNSKGCDFTHSLCYLSPWGCIVIPWYIYSLKLEILLNNV